MLRHLLTFFHCASYAGQRKPRRQMVPRRIGQRCVPLAKLALPVGALAMVGALLAVVLVGGVLGAAEARPAPPPLCSTSGPVAGLSDAQAQNARTVVAVASTSGGERAALISLMVGLAESQLLVLSNPSVAAGHDLPAQGVGSDHDSLGIFQQRAGWGSAAQRMDPVTSTNLFVNALMSVTGWDIKDPWVSAQDVQRSAFDGRPSAVNHYSLVYGENYLSQLERASAALRAITGSGAPLDCGGGFGTAPSGPTDAFGLPSRYAIPETSSLPARAAITTALAQRGKPYLWGATGPDGFDCSGLMLRAWSAAGASLRRTTQQQVNDGSPSSLATILPGDLVLVAGSDGTLASPGHVGMYLGEGLAIHAPHTGDVVRVVTLASFTADGVSAVRHIG